MATGKDKSNKDKAMAAMLKKFGIQRTTTQCGICHRLIAVGTAALFAHFASSCKSRRPQLGAFKGRRAA